MPLSRKELDLVRHGTHEDRERILQQLREAQKAREAREVQETKNPPANYDKLVEGVTADVFTAQGERILSQESIRGTDRVK